MLYVLSVCSPIPALSAWVLGMQFSFACRTIYNLSPMLTSSRVCVPHRLPKQVERARIRNRDGEILVRSGFSLSAMTSSHVAELTSDLLYS